MKRNALLLVIAFLGFASNTIAQTQNNSVHVSGAMKNVMRKGELHGTILLDTLSNKKHLYGLGPLEYLKGELLVIDGKSYVSRVGTNQEIIMEETYKVKAPFFVYTNQAEFTKHTLPASIKNSNDLEAYLNKITQSYKRPFVFKLEGEFTQVDFHIQNLPEGTVVKSMKDAHTGQGKYISKNTKGTIVGFFSTEHQTVFTHHDSYIHLHYINEKATEMGHIDGLEFNGTSAITLYLPKE